MSRAGGGRGLSAVASTRANAVTAQTDAAVADVALGEASWLRQALVLAARGRADSVESFLHPFELPVKIQDTRATCRTHFVVCGPDGAPRVDELSRRLAAEIVDFCIPRGRIEDAKRAFLRDGATLPFIRLEQEARDLFTSLANSGEGGELLLYMLLEVVLRIPQVLCKMPLKTSSQMHVHGADGVHAKAKADGGLALYWGESKLYGSAADAVRECLASLAGFLLGGPEGRRRDMLLLRDHAQLEDEALTRALRAFFDDDDPRSARVEYRGACLVGFDYHDYPDVRAAGADVQAQLRAAVDDWATTIGRRVGMSKLSAVELEVFCVPFPSVAVFRSAVARELSL